MRRYATIGPGNTARHQKENTMIDEDDTQTADLLRTVTEATDYRLAVTKATDYRLAELDRIDILLSGIKPPGEDGPTTAAEFTAAEFTAAEFTVAGFGTGTVAELEFHIAQITEERDTLRKEAHSATTNAALALYDAIGLATNTAMAELIATVEEQADDIRDLRADLEERDQMAEPDIDAIWAEISDRVDEAAAEAARDVIRDELVVTVDLI
jgi:gas vesicle protein